jgi:hypothetical protein
LDLIIDTSFSLSLGATIDLLRLIFEDALLLLDLTVSVTKSSYIINVKATVYLHHHAKTVELF